MVMAMVGPPPNYLIRYNYHDYVISYVIIKNQNKFRTPPHQYTAQFSITYIIHDGQENQRCTYNFTQQSQCKQSKRLNYESI
jgi:hypothetical protein